MLSHVKFGLPPKPVVLDQYGNCPAVPVPDTVPPLPLADKTPVVASNAKPVPSVISPGVPVVVNLFPIKDFADIV